MYDKCALCLRTDHRNPIKCPHLWSAIKLLKARYKWTISRTPDDWPFDLPRCRLCHATHHLVYCAKFPELRKVAVGLAQRTHRDQALPAYRTLKAPNVVQVGHRANTTNQQGKPPIANMMNMAPPPYTGPPPPGYTEKGYGTQATPTVNYAPPFDMPTSN